MFPEVKVTEFGSYRVETYRLMGNYETYVECDGIRLSEFDSYVASRDIAIELHEFLCEELKKKCPVEPNWVVIGF